VPSPVKILLPGRTRWVFRPSRPQQHFPVPRIFRTCNAALGSPAARLFQQKSSKRSPKAYTLENSMMMPESDNMK